VDESFADGVFMVGRGADGVRYTSEVAVFVRRWLSLAELSALLRSLAPERFGRLCAILARQWREG
jgi:hypothetical protein